MLVEQEESIEKIGSFIEKNTKLPRIAGKIFGYLLICEPSEQTAKQIIEKLNIAKSSVSSMMKLLIQTNLVEEITKSRERSKFYKIKEKGWEEMLLKKLEDLTNIKVLFGNNNFQLKNPKSKNKISQLEQFYSFLENEISFLIKKWKKQND